MKPKYVHIEFNGWDTIASYIHDRKELEVWLKDGSLKEDDVIYELKSKYHVVKWKDGSLVLEDVTNEEEKAKP